MKFVAILLAVVPLISNADFVARQGEDSVRFHEKPCTHELVLQRLSPEVVEHFQAATTVIQGQTYQACWRVMGNAAYLIYEDGDQGVIPVSDMKPALEV